MEARERLIVALDVDAQEEAFALVDELSSVVDIFKVGIAPFTGYGSALVEKINKKGKKVFLDLKFHDIPNTVKNAARVSAMQGVFMTNFHCLGGRRMLEAAVEGAKEGSAKAGENPPILLGVTVLTSMDEREMKGIGLSGRLEEKVIEFAKMAADSGLDGVVASAREAAGIKEKIGKDFVVVTPGVRPVWAAAGDQKRIVTPRKAVQNGADYVVVGRPIIKADDPAEAAKRIIEEMK